MSSQETKHWFLHVDLDAFFASVEQLDNPDLRGKPVIVGGKPDDRRSVVSTASYEARAFGVHSAMPTFQAYRLCPQGIFVHGRMERYAELSYQIMNIFRDYSPDVDQMSIDEAFIDLTGTEGLFGPPAETALKIKKRVKEETGLTVSVGLAGTKYLAKIASGLSKPDGFYQIKKGQEENFMLSLPLNKVWGLGPKSLELIRSKGLNTTREIFEQDYETLDFLFGKNMAAFLYNVVRGIEKESFSREVKSHSISAETTFPYDLTDIYSIETELLELAHGVYFRLLKEESYSRTAFVKIRYDDFSTSTIQETCERNIITLDSFFEIIKRLFEKRYDNNRGIRLLGVGFENITKDDKPYQQELFENNDEKKQAVEKAILKLSKKHPEIKVHKARTLKAAAALFLSLTLFNKSLYAGEEQKPGELPSKEAPSIFEYDINDKNHVDLDVSGYWQGFLKEDLTLSFGNGTKPAFSIPVPVFKQDVELSAHLLLNKQWFFFADFADSFNKNTLTAGYQGNGLIRKAYVSNRDVTMPGVYSASFFGFGLEGGKNQAPGFAMNLLSPTDKWQADFLLRYDMTEIKSAVWYGMNSVSDTKSSISNFMHGREFRFPEASANLLSAISAVYIEADSGRYTDSKGKKYRRLSSEEYAVLTDKKRLLISSAAGGGKGFLSGNRSGFVPTILITFVSSADVQTMISYEGSYTTPLSFLGKIQTELGKNGKYNIQDFAYNQQTSINGEAALIIQNTTGFSPFLCPYNYDLGKAQTNSDYDVSVIYRNSEKNLQEFSAVNTDEAYTTLFIDFFKEKHSYIQIINNDSPDSVYPFASYAPEIYLNLENKSDLCLLSRFYSPQKEFRISKDAAAGSIIVYKNGSVVNGVSYSNETGIVNLGQAVSTSDKIVITWQEDTKDFSKGSITAGGGIKYKLLPGLEADASLTGRWPMPVNAGYALNANNTIKNGFIALSSGISWEKDNLKLTEKAAVSLQQDNTAKGLLVLNQDDNLPHTYYHDISSASRVEKDSEISGYIIPLQWTSVNEAQNSPASIDIKLSAGSLLMNSESLELAVKADFTADTSAFSGTETLDTHLEVYLISGIKAGQTPSDIELNDYPHWKLNTEGKLRLSESQWQKITISLSDLDRSRLTADSDARLYIKRADTSSQKDISGSLYLGPYEPVLKACNIDAPEAFNVSTRTEKESVNEYSSLVKWNFDSSTLPAGLSDKDIISTKYFTPADFSSYKTISWRLKANPFIPLIFILDNNDRDSREALRLELKHTSYYDHFAADAFHNLTINLKTKEVFIDQEKVPQAEYSLYIDSRNIPSRQKIILKISEDNSHFHQGEFRNGRLSFDEAEVYCTVQNYIAAEYKKDGIILKAGKFPLLKDFEASLSSQQSTGKLPATDFAVNARLHTGITLAGIAATTDISTNQFSIDSASHSVKTDSSLIKVFFAEENYHHEGAAKEIRKEDSFALNFSDLNISRISIPVKVSFKSSVQDNLTRGSQKTEAAFEYKQPIKNINLSLTSNLSLSQKTLTAFSVNKATSSDSYFKDWADITAIQFSSGRPDAANRGEIFSTKLSSEIPIKSVAFKPQLEYSLEGSYKKSADPLFSAKEGLSLLLPFAFRDNAIGFEISRKGGESRNLSATDTLLTNGSYLSDWSETTGQQCRHQFFYTSVPFYELFDFRLPQKINGQYSAKYELKYNRRISNSFKDLYIPSALSLAVSRDISSNDGRKSDVYNLKAVITNNSINNFGKNSYKKIFTWFEQEELFSTLTALVKIPYGSDAALENTKFQINAYMQLMLLIKDKTTFTSSLDFSFNSDALWSTKGIFIYERPAASCIFTSLTELVIPGYKLQTDSIKRKDSVSIDLSQTADNFTQKYGWNHYAEVKFRKHYYINGEFGILFTKNTKISDSLSFNLSLGAKAEF